MSFLGIFWGLWGISMWVTQPEHQKGAKDEVKRPIGSPARSQGREGPYPFSIQILEISSDSKIYYII